MFRDTLNFIKNFKGRNFGLQQTAFNCKRYFTKGKNLVERSSKCGVVYHIPCGNCTGIYIGETGRAYQTRLAENKRPASLAKIDHNNLNKKKGVG